MQSGIAAVLGTQGNVEMSGISGIAKPNFPLQDMNMEILGKIFWQNISQQIISRQNISWQLFTARHEHVNSWKKKDCFSARYHIKFGSFQTSGNSLYQSCFLRNKLESEGGLESGVESKYQQFLASFTTLVKRRPINLQLMLMLTNVVQFQLNARQIAKATDVDIDQQ